MEQKEEKLKVNYGPRQTQDAQVSRLERKGFKNEGDTSMGIVLMKIDNEGYVEKYVVDITGRVQKYKPYKPSQEERMRLPKDKSKIANNFVID